SEERFRLLARDSDVLVFEINYLEHTLEFNENFEKILGIKPDYQSFLDGKWVYPDDVTSFSRILPQSSSKKGVMTRNIRFCNSAGVYIWFSLLTSIFADDRGRVVRILGKMMNIDESMREKEALRLRAETDSMTGLYNKMATEELITHALRKYRGSVCALLVVDMDNLKRINDTLGHAQGDRAIVRFADVLHRTFRSTDIVGRIGGDEFMVFLINVQRNQQLTMILDAIVKKWETLYTGEKEDYPVHGSMGAVMTEGCENFQELYRRADIALYKAKRSGKGGYAVYVPEMEET
ncbi:MAG: diguanylate cyclase domain-containing protein, partial [Blautia coccoides]